MWFKRLLHLALCLLDLPDRTHIGRMQVPRSDTNLLLFSSFASKRYRILALGVGKHAMTCTYLFVLSSLQVQLRANVPQLLVRPLPSAFLPRDLVVLTK